MTVKAKEVKEFITVVNPDGSYRIPLAKAQTIRFEGSVLSPSMFGHIVDVLGRYEHCGLTIEEIEACAKHIDNK